MGTKFEEDANLAYNEAIAKSFCSWKKDSMLWMDSKLNRNPHDKLVNQPLTRRKSVKGIKMDTIKNDLNLNTVATNTADGYFIKKLVPSKNVDLQAKTEREAIILSPKRIPSEARDNTRRIKRSSHAQSTNNLQNLPVNCRFNDVHNNKSYIDNGDSASKQNKSYARLALNSTDESKHLPTQIKDKFSNVIQKSKSMHFNLQTFSCKMHESETEFERNEEVVRRHSVPSLGNSTRVTDVITDIYLDQMNKLRCEVMGPEDDKTTNSKLSREKKKKTKCLKHQHNCVTESSSIHSEDETISSLETINI